MIQPERLCLVAPEKPGIWLYTCEILRHAGLPFEYVPAGQITERLKAPRKLLLLVGSQQLPESAADAICAAVQSGSALVAVGAPAGLDDLFGVRPAESGIQPSIEPTGPFEGYSGTFGFSLLRDVGEGYLRRSGAHRVTERLDPPLHIFGAAAVTAQAGTEALADILDVHQAPLGLAGITIRRLGSGLAMLIAPDIAASVSAMQQGRFIDRDALPAPDGSAPLNDGILKAEDGLVLDWHFDRQYADQMGCAAFLTPQADRLRELLIRSLIWAAEQTGCVLPMLWYHPEGRPATAMLSLDSDLSGPAEARHSLELLERLKVPACWCVMPPGYPRPTYEAIKAQGHEIALHFDAQRVEDPQAAWSRQTLRRQYEWLTDAARLDRITSNKNHYTRWQGRLEFFEWLAELGIEVDQSKGPSKRGTLGFPFGSCHPWRPIRDDGSLIDVLEIPLPTQDVPITARPESLRLWLQASLEVGGVMHLLFHPYHLTKEPVSRALAEIVEAARQSGLVWQRSDEINAWHRARYSFEAVPARRGIGWQIRTERPLDGACLLVFGAGQSRQIVINGRSHTPQRVQRFGSEALQLITDLRGETDLQLAGL